MFAFFSESGLFCVRIGLPFIRQRVGRRRGWRRRGEVRGEEGRRRGGEEKREEAERRGEERRGEEMGEKRKEEERGKERRREDERRREEGKVGAEESSPTFSYHLPLQDSDKRAGHISLISVGQISLTNSSSLLQNSQNGHSPLELSESGGKVVPLGDDKTVIEISE